MWLNIGSLHMFAHNSLATKTTNYGQNVGLSEFYIVYNGVCLKVRKHLL